jgi:FtsZ-binding cell division protein ZapB
MILRQINASVRNLEKIPDIIQEAIDVLQTAESEIEELREANERLSKKIDKLGEGQ